MLRPLANTVAVAATLLSCSQGIAAPCQAESGMRRAALLELYTSEGCDSCPPADRWVSGLLARGLVPDRVVVLAFHVDYWNYLGWADPYSRAEYSARQRTASQRRKARVVYTPQLLLNGDDYRRGYLHDDFSGRVHALNQGAAKARINLRLETDAANVLTVHGTATVPDASGRSGTRAYLALYENNLSSQVTAGENRSRQLRHDFVVRELAGPYAVEPQGMAALSHRFKLDRRWKTADLHLAAFVQNGLTGDVLQALAMPYCR